MRLSRIVLVFPLAAILASVACSGPRVRLTEWKEDNFTTCCIKKGCDEKEFMKASKPFCSGDIDMIGGKFVNGIAGYETTSKKDLTFKPIVSEQSCRTFKCKGKIVVPQ